VESGLKIEDRGSILDPLIRLIERVESDRG